MIQTSADFENVINRETRTFLARMVFGTFTLSEEIRQITICMGNADGEAFIDGAAYSSHVNISMNISNTDITGQEFRLEIGLLLDDETVEYVPIGIYKAAAADITKTKYTMTVTAWDRMGRNANTVYEPAVLYPCTAGAVLDDITNQTGLVFDTTEFPGIREEEGLSFPPEYLISNVIGFVAGLRGGFAYVDYTGTVVLARYPTVSSLTVPAARCLDEIALQDNLYSVNAGGEVTAYSYYPGTVRFLGDPRLEPKDMITVIDTLDVSRNVPCMGITVTYDGGLTTVISAPAQATTDREWGPIQNKLNAAILAAESAITESRREYTTTDSTDPPEETAEWSTSPPAHVDGQYIWERTVNTYGSGQTETGEPVLITGNSGEAGEDAVLLRLDSSNGLIFKNNTVDTVLSVTIYKGSQVITDADTMHAVFGAGSYIQWNWLRLGENRYGVLSTDDSRIYDGGFKLRLTPADVDTKVTFQCSLMVE